MGVCHGLTDIQIRTAKAKEKDYKLSDSEGLFLMVATTGGKRWRFKYRFGGKEKLLALGTYPDVSLQDARTKLREARNMLANGFDPGAAALASYGWRSNPNTGKQLPMNKQTMKGYISEPSFTVQFEICWQFSKLCDHKTILVQQVLGYDHSLIAESGYSWGLQALFRMCRNNVSSP